MVRFIGFSDLHVDHYLKGKRGVKYSQRTHDMLGFLDLIISDAIERQVDFVLFAGDMYDTSRPSPSIKTAVHERILRLKRAGIPFYGIPGNHDMSPSALSVDSLAELTSLEVPGVHIFHTPGILDVGEYCIAGIPWCFTPYQRLEVPADKPVYCIAHATVFGAQYNDVMTTERVNGKEFVLQLEDLTPFTFTLLGHIHKPQLLSSEPPILYPGSVGNQDWGELEQHYYVYAEGTEWEFIPYQDRARIKYHLDMETPVPPMADPNAFYQFTIPHRYPRYNIEREYKKAHSLEINTIHETTISERRQRVSKINDSMTPFEAICTYFEEIGEEFPEEEKLLAKEIFENVHP